jgi:hypothetical protein
MRLMKASAISVVPTLVAVLTLAALVSLSQTASAQDNDRETRFRTALKGAPIDHVKPHGRAEFEQQQRQDDGGGQKTRFSAEVDDVKVSNGTTLEVDVDGAKVGNIRVRGGSGDLQVHGKRAPNIKKGSVVSVMLNGQAILSGTF